MFKILFLETNDFFCSSSGKIDEKQIKEAYFYLFEDYYASYSYPTDWRYKF
jgi:hypothetical protein